MTASGLKPSLNGGSLPTEVTQVKAKVKVKVKVKVNLRLAVYHQSVHLGVKPLETHDQIFYLTEPLR
jgi:hypothetical protein